MKSQTHLSAGIFAALVIAKAGIVSVTGHGYLLFALLGSLLPDIDNHNSKLGRKVPGLSRVAEFLMGHRGIYHSLFGCAATLIVFFLIFRVFSIAAWECYVAAIVVGFISHLVMDSLTTKGIRWFKPLHSFKIRGPFKTGGWMDSAFSIAFLVFIGFVVKSMGVGVLRII